MKITPRLMDKLTEFYDKREPLPAWDIVAQSAERKKQGRESTGRQVYKVEADPQELVDRGLLAADRIADRDAVEAALQQLLDGRLAEPPPAPAGKPAGKRTKAAGRKVSGGRKPSGKTLPLFPET